MIACTAALVPLTDTPVWFHVRNNANAFASESTFETTVIELLVPVESDVIFKTLPSVLMEAPAMKQDGGMVILLQVIQDTTQDFGTRVQRIGVMTID